MSLEPWLPLMEIIQMVERESTVAKQLGDEITIRRFVRFQVGEAA